MAGGCWRFQARVWKLCNKCGEQDYVGQNKQRCNKCGGLLSKVKYCKGSASVANREKLEMERKGGKVGMETLLDEAYSDLPPRDI